MKKIMIFLLFLVLTSCATKPKIIQTPLIKGTIAVLNFKNNSPNANWNYMESAVAEIFTSNLTNNSNFKVVERESLNKILEEQKLNQSGIIDEDMAVKIGKILGATDIVFGSITQLGNTIVISARVVKLKPARFMPAKQPAVKVKKNLPR